MKTNRNLPSRAAADQLLDDAAAGPLTGHDALGSLLSAAAAPASDRELAGEAKAVLAFRSAHLGPAPRPRRSSMSATKLLAAKAVLAALGVTGGGVALAAATGHLPANLTGTPAAASSAASSAGASARPSGTADPKSHPSASPSPNLRGLCQAYTAQVGNNPGKALSNPAFTALITAAGGKSGVASFCAKTLAAAPGNAPTAHATGKPSSLPTTANTAHPTGAPTTHPTGKPTAHP